MKEGVCKCKRKYFYIGLDFGLCTKCLDAIEDTSNNHSKIQNKNNIHSEKQNGDKNVHE